MHWVIEIHRECIELIERKVPGLVFTIDDETEYDPYENPWLEATLYIIVDAENKEEAKKIYKKNAIRDDLLGQWYVYYNIVKIVNHDDFSKYENVHYKTHWSIDE